MEKSENCLFFGNYNSFRSQSWLNTCSQNRQSTNFQNHKNINFVEKLYFFIVYNQVYIAKHVVKSLHSGFIFSKKYKSLQSWRVNE